MANSSSEDTGFATSYIKGDWGKTRFIADQNVDNLMSVVVNLGTELWAVRRRQMAMEALLDKGRVVTAQALETYEPTEAERAAWAAERDDTIERIYSVLNRVSHPAHGVAPKGDKVPPMGA